MKQHVNISMIQINFDGVNADFYLFENTNFHGKVINEIRLYAAPSGIAVQSPFDGRQLLDESLLSNLYVNMVRDDKTVVSNGLNGKEIDMIANKSWPIDDRINFTMSFIRYNDPATLASTSGKCILVYVYYDTVECDNSMADMPASGVTVEIETSAQAVKLSDYITDYIGQQSQRVKALDAVTSSGGHWFLSLRDIAGRTCEYLPDRRLQMNDGTLPVQYPFAFDDYDVDFRNSWLYNVGGGTLKVAINFYY